MINIINDWVHREIERYRLDRKIAKELPQLSLVQQVMFRDGIIDAVEELIEEAIEHQEALDEMFPMPEKKALFE